MIRTTRTLLLASLSAPAALAQGLPTAFVIDADGDKVWSCRDLDNNGDVNGPNETSVFYDDQVGPIVLSVPAGTWRATDGALFVTDTTEDIVLRLIDLDGDGTAHGVGEATVWFDGRLGGNLDGVVMTSGRGPWRDADGTLWVASSNTTAGGNDAILRLADVNGDGDANDLGESREYYVIAPGSSVGTAIPAGIVRGSDGALYYAENGTGATLPRGVYRLEDLDGSGVIDQPSEVTTAFLAPPQGGTAFHWSFARDAQGRMYLGDTGNDVVWRLDDANANGIIEPSEGTLYWAAAGTSLAWAIDVADDGALFLAEDQTPDRVLRLVDTNGDGTIDPVTETQTLYDDTLSPNDLGSPRAIAVIKASGPGTVYCTPAALNSTGVPARMSASGSASVAANDLVLHADSLPNNSFGFFLASRTQGFVANPAGSQGNLCLGGAIGRFVGPGQIKNSGAVGAIALAVDNLRLPLPTGLVAAQVGEQWHFTAWFRDVAAGNATSNFADGLSVTFQ